MICINADDFQNILKQTPMLKIEAWEKLQQIKHIEVHTPLGEVAIVWFDDNEAKPKSVTFAELLQKIDELDETNCKRKTRIYTTNFLEKAPKEIIDKELKKLDDEHEELEKLYKILEGLKDNENNKE